MSTPPVSPPDRDVRLLRSVRLQNLLSFGPDTPALDLRPLNVLIGANGSGKSNVLAALSLLPHLAGDVNEAFRHGGSTLREWLHKGDRTRTAAIEVVVSGADEDAIVHYISFTEQDWRFWVRKETVTLLDDYHGQSPAFYEREFDHSGDGYSTAGLIIDLEAPDRPEELDTDETGSALSQLRDRRRFRAFATLTDAYEGIALFRNYTFGGDSPLRQPQRGDSPGNFLREGGANLALVLNQLRRDFEAKDRIVALLDELYENIKDYETFTQVAYVELALREGQHIIRVAIG